MHPRNIYRKPPNFVELSLSYAEFRSIAKLDVDGRVRIDFKDANNVRTLTKCLLHKDFNLDVLLPENKLVPTLPLRLNYILWIEDIMTAMEISNIKGIDIGCGASCIYPLLAASCNKWKMYGLECNAESIQYAKENVKRNSLSGLIEIISQNESDNILSNIDHVEADFCMCNPPFFESADVDDTRNNNRTGKRPSPKTVKTGSAHELCIEGGEIEFVRKIIDESCRIKKNIKIYTTMVGHKRSVQIIVSELKSRGIMNYIETDFCQGKTIRWGIAWTFLNQYLLRKVPSTTENKTNKYFSHTITTKKTISTIFDQLREMFYNLEISIKNLTIVEAEISFDITAIKKTWANQRKKKRMLKSKHKNESETVNELINTDNAIVKRLRLNSNELLCNDKFNDVKSEEDNSSILDIGFIITKENDNVVLKLKYLNGLLGRDGVHQVLQYIINSLKT